MKVANYIAEFLVKNQIEDVFTVTGGGAMHLNDAFGHASGLRCIYNNHEQACAIAAEGYTRLTGKLAAVCVTSGPGGTNAITGVLGGWLDSIPMLIISGQVKREMTTWSCSELGLRQLGDQEFNITDTVRNFTKYAVMVTDSNEIAYHLEKALFLCRQGKGGPVWLDIPLDIQGSNIELSDLKHYNSCEDSMNIEPRFDLQDAQKLLTMIRNAKAPLILSGSSIQYSKSEEIFLQLVNKLRIPVVTAWAANDTLPYDSPYFMGVPGTLGTRAANFAVQQCDLLISLGSRMNVRTVGYTRGDFGKNAYKVMIDICDAELKKPTYQPDWGIRADVKEVIDKLLESEYQRPDYHDKWLNWCRNIFRRYPVVMENYHNNSKNINPYVFVETLFKHMANDDTMVCSNGSACVMPIQVSMLKKGQRLFCNSGCAAMGYGLPAALGAAVALKGERVVCMEGDGSIMMNLQELATIKLYQLNTKIVIINNNGYHSIRQTQKNNFGEPLVGVNKQSGVAIPDFSRIAYAFELPYFSISGEEEADEVVEQMLEAEGPVICEVFVDEEQPFAPKSSAKVLPDGSIVSPSIDDMSPFLSHEEYEKIKNSWK